MTTPPLPETPTMRIRLDYTNSAGQDLGSRFFLKYAGSAPSGDNCTAIAAAIAAAWQTHLDGHVQENYALTEVDVLDIASYDGLSGQWTGSYPGTDDSTALPDTVAVNIEFGIARRYRGGKPRMFLPPPGADSLENDYQWSTTFIENLTTDWDAFITAVEAIDVGAVGALTHVNVSYYSGFTNVENTSGRMRAAPKYRTPSALVDTITGYFPKTLIGSQRKRRKSTTY